jgi:hypothetical protein
MRPHYAKGFSTRRALRSMLAVVGLGLALVMQLAPAAAQGADVASAKLARDGYTLTKDGAEELESLLRNRPDDLTARTKLLGFYFRGARTYSREITIEARRRHILWLIENSPGAEASGLSEATIDAKGHAMADPTGFEQASVLWMEQARQHPTDVKVLNHAANFFRLSDKERAVSLLRQAQSAEPDSREWPARIGYVTALAILGIDMVNQNGLPTSHNAAEAKEPFALRAIDELMASPDATLVGVAGTIIGQYGLMRSVIYRGPEKFAVDHVALSEALLARAQQLEPANPQWPRNLEQVRALRATANQAK